MRVWEKFLRVDGWRSGYASVDRVLRHYSRKVMSEKTRMNFCGTLMRFCRFCGLDPDELAGLSVDEASRLCQKFTEHLKRLKFSARYVNVSQAYLRTFFRLNGFEDDRELRVKRYYQPTLYRKKPEHVPTPEEIYRMGYASGSAKNRSMIYALYTGGLRNSTLRAIRYGDVRKELEAGLKVIRIPVYPEMKKVDPAACKGNITYYTFIDPEAVKALREYLEERSRIFGDIGDEEPLFHSESNHVPREKQRFTPVSKNGLARIVKRAAKQAGIRRWRDVTPHCLRKAFESTLRNNRVNPKDREFLMGHILPGSQDAYYDHAKTEDLRKKYMQIEFFPHTAGSIEEMRKKQVIDIVRILGFPEEKIKRVEEALARYRTVDEAMKDIRKLSLETYRLKEKGESDPKKIVEEEELERYLNDGWDVQTVLSSGRILIRRTHK